MSMLRFLTLLLVLGIAGTSFAHADDGKTTVTPPVAFRPADFHGAIGSLKISMHAQPTKLQAEDSIILTVRINGQGNLGELERPNLRKNPAFFRSFDVTNLGDRYDADQGAREFDYRLRPRYTSVREIPRLALVYFKPGFTPPEKGYQTTYAAPVPLQVLPRPELSPTQVQGATEAAVPESVRQFVSGERVLQQPATPMFSRSWLVIPLLLAPPLVCLLWCVAARPRQHVVRRMQLSRQARKTIKALERCEEANGWNEFGAIITNYLGQFVGRLPSEVSPRLIVDQMLAHGCSPEVANEVAALFEWREAARFAQGLASFPISAKANATRLITVLEEQPWH
jgi:hypothetical protein